MADPRLTLEEPAGAPRHPAFAPGTGSPPGEAPLSDETRMGVLLVAAGVLSLLERARWHLAAGFDGAVVDEAGRLRGLRASPGSPRVGAQERLRRLLFDLLRARDTICGRGRARAAARRLAERWQQTITPVSPDRAVEEILDAVPFLWDAKLGRFRRGLVGELGVREGRQLWVAGPTHFRRRVRRRARNAEAAADLLAAPAARRLWPRGLGIPPGRLAASGQWAALADRLTAESTESPERRLALARAAYAAGRFTAALEATAGLRSAEARILRLQCRTQLAEYHAVRRVLGRLAGSTWSPWQTVELTDLAVRVLANQGDCDGARFWLEKALAVRQPRARLYARLVAASAAWDVGDSQQARRHLRTARPAIDDPELAWRWHAVRGQVAMQDGEPAVMVRHLRSALGTDRRGRTVFEAGRLWNELGVGRVLANDLAGAERAFRHATRLLDRCEGPACTSLARCNLAEVRIRRGRLRGVRHVLESTAALHRSNGNRRGQVEDTALAARLDLAQGQPDRAHRRLASELERMAKEGVVWRRELLQLLAARALGWMGRREEAAALLEAGGERALADLEPEEGPAVWALAGRPDEARAAATASPLGRIWRAVLDESEVTAEEWQALDRLEPWRAARWVYDVERVAPGRVPAERRRRAGITLRRQGAHELADELERGGLGIWRGLARYLDGEEDPGRLLTRAGYRGARVTWMDATGSHVLVDGEGGEECLSAPCAGGTLELHHERVDDPLRGLFAVIRSSLERRPPTTGRTSRPATDLIGDDARFQEAVARADRLATGEVPVLILGETGTGKELVARRIHRLSDRERGPFLPVNCAAFSENLIQSELFGHARGAFTDARHDRSGVLESAAGGTVLLDEIGDLTLPIQGMLLRALQEGEIRRLGESRPRPIDVRVVAATHRELDDMVRRGAFRADLFYRLDVGRVELPPLRERGDDVLRLARHFLAWHGSPVPRLTRAARRRLRDWTWPGNVRELKNRLAVACTLAGGGTIDVEHLELPEEPAESTCTLSEQLDDLRRRSIRRALDSSDGNRAAAARRLGMTRQALAYQMKRLGLV